MNDSGQEARSTRAFFLDRDGVLVEDVDLLTSSEQVRIPPGVVDALRAIDHHGYLTVVVTNQTVIARGLISEERLQEIHQALLEQLRKAGAPAIAGLYVCPHHPHADVLAYRKECECRKPKPGLLHQAADELGIDLSVSFMVGDRLSDVAAGKAAGCTTVLIESGAHGARPIVGMSADPPAPDYRFASLGEATKALLVNRS